MKKEEINIPEEIFAQFGVGFFIAILTSGAALSALGAYEKFIVGQRHICAVLLSGTFMFTVVNSWWLKVYTDGVSNLRKYELSQNQRFLSNLCSLLVALAVSLPFLFVFNREELFIPAGVLLCIILLQWATYFIGKIVALNKIKYYTKLEFNGLNLILFFFITLTIAEYFNAQQLPVPILLAYFTFGIFLMTTIVTLCLLANCVRKIYRQITELPVLLRPHNEFLANTV